MRHLTKRSTLTFITLAILCCSVAAQGGKAEPKRISFATGKSSGTVAGTLSNNQEMDYVFGAKAGQAITLKVTSRGDLFDFKLLGDGFDIPTEHDAFTDYSFTAPETGDYFVFVRKRSSTKMPKAKFLLTLTIK